MYINQNTGLRPFIITLSGKARNGKDYVADLLKQKFEEAGKRVIIAHYADELKFICRQFYGWNGNKDEIGRALLQYVGTEVYRSKDMHYWVERFISMFDKFGKDDKISVGQYCWQPPEVIIVPDTRFPNEMLGWVACGYPILPLAVIRMDAVQLDKDSVTPKHLSVKDLISLVESNKVQLTPFKNDLNGNAQAHPSETALDPYVFNVDGKGPNPNIALIGSSNSANERVSAMNTNLDNDENNIFVRTAAMYMKMHTESEVDTAKFRTSEMAIIPFREHLNNIFKAFVERNMAFITNVTDNPSIVEADVNNVVRSVCANVLDAGGGNV